MEGNDEALASRIALAATMESFVCIHETSHVGTNMAHRVLGSDPIHGGCFKNNYIIRARRVKNLKRHFFVKKR